MTDETANEAKAPTKVKAPTKADLQEQIKALLAEKEARESNPAPEDEGDKVMVQCVCDNVHINTGEANQILRATRPSPNANYEDGDTAMVSAGLADILVRKRQCIIVK